MEQSRTGDSWERPWMQDEEIVLLEGFIQPEHVYLEWGSGGSTATLAPRAARAYSIEHDRRWYRRLRDLLDLETVSLRCVPVEPGHEGWQGGFDEGTYAQFRPYVDAVESLGPERFDRVLIDGRARVACGLKVLPFLDPHSLVFVHDFWSRPHYWILLRWYELVAAVFPGQSLAVLRRRADLDGPYPTPTEVDIPGPPSGGRAVPELGGRFILRRGTLELRPDPITVARKGPEP